jgi:hypothetical protein
LESKARKVLWSRASAFVIVVIVGWVFFTNLVQGWNRVKDYELSLNWAWPASVLLFAIAVIVSGVLWGRILRSLRVTGLTNKEAARSHLAAWLMRYIPGVGSFIYKMNWASNKGIPKSLAVIAIIYESAFLQLASIIGGASIILLISGPRLIEESVLASAMIVVMLSLLAIGLSRPVFSRVLKYLGKGRIGGKSKISSLELLSGGRSLLFVIEFLVPRIINGAGAALVAWALFNPPPEKLLLIGAAYVIAGAIGILAFFTPSGLGVREGTLAIILSATGTPLVDSIFLALVLRLLATLADLVVAAALAALTAFKGKGDIELV